CLPIIFIAADTSPAGMTAPITPTARPCAAVNATTTLLEQRDKFRYRRRLIKALVFPDKILVAMIAKKRLVQRNHFCAGKDPERCGIGKHRLDICWLVHRLTLLASCSALILAQASSTLSAF